MAEFDIPMEEILDLDPEPNPSKCRTKTCWNTRAGRLSVCNKCWTLVKRARNPTRTAYQDIKNRAKRREQTFTITFEEFCEIIAGTGYIENRGRGAGALHLDRKDPLKGYEWGNLEVKTATINCSKATADKAKHRASYTPELVALNSNPEDPF